MRLFLVAALAAVLACSAQSPAPTSIPFDVWVATNTKVYSTPQEALYRQAVYSANAARVISHNAQPGVTYQLALNTFADMPPSEFASRYLGLQPPASLDPNVGSPLPPLVDNWGNGVGLLYSPRRVAASDASATSTVSSSPTGSPTPTTTTTGSHTPSNSNGAPQAFTPTSTVSSSPTPTPTPTSTVSGSYTPAPMPSFPAVPSTTSTSTGAPSFPPPPPPPESSLEASASNTPSSSSTVTASPSSTATGTPTPTGTSSGTGTPTAEPSPDPSPSRTSFPSASSTPSPTGTPAPAAPTAAAASVDWTQRKGVVLPVRDQGSCGSCWAYSTIAAVEATMAIAGGVAVPLSTQQLVDCALQGNSGCDGGSLTAAFAYTQASGACADSSYPYTGVQRGCRACVPVARITGYVTVPSGSDANLEDALRQQPVAVAVSAGVTAWQLYSSGILTGSCSGALDHAVLAVGFCTDSNGRDYWKLKNQWGTGWGEAGFARLARGAVYEPSGQCGVLSWSVYPTV